LHAKQMLRSSHAIFLLGTRRLAKNWSKAPFVIFVSACVYVLMTNGLVTLTFMHMSIQIYAYKYTTMLQTQMRYLQPLMSHFGPSSKG